MSQHGVNDWQRLLGELEAAQARAQAAIHELRALAQATRANQADGGEPSTADILVRIATSAGTDRVIETLCTGLRALAPDHCGSIFLQHEDGELPNVVGVWQPDRQWVDSVQGLHRHVEDKRPALLLEELQNCPAGQVISLPLHALGLELGEVRIWQPDGPLSSLPADCRGATQVAALALAGLRLRIKARSRAMRDPLTGLFNRRYLTDTLPREFHRCRRNSKPLGLIGIDLDGFSRFNQRHGTVNGDRLLQAMGGLLQASFRGSDICCRTEGGQFLVVMPEADLQNTRRRAEELLPIIAALTVQRGHQAVSSPTASIGVAAYPEQAEGADELLAAVDSARLMAVQAGGNQVRIAERIEHAPT
ncbi:diguanylate cyclase (GGDEF)-like protein [Natronocella acetinitrilica]|uniref:diguanylate cyclase n=1 Tax=Natronocella acetinitrilica TaxID=414046 RepID=A0AAE3KBI5_9GAMM|nr:GGDEF domain-containing protein [Natronocella acetinitrilica]MCP1674706.1 diguanylate cyclase (GGDEF)-like protein [Natronocella acetinitrilica]